MTKNQYDDWLKNVSISKIDKKSKVIVKVKKTTTAGNDEKPISSIIPDKDQSYVPKDYNDGAVQSFANGLEAEMSIDQITSKKFKNQYGKL